MKVVHEIPPFVEEDSTILILGSVPSVQSRQQEFYYMHPENRFWKVLASVFRESCPNGIDSKKAFLKRHKIALYDVVFSCEIEGSKDATIRDVVPTKLLPLIKKSKIARIYTTGKKAYELYQKYQEKELGIKAISLPSTSPLNASYHLEDLIKAYQVLKEKKVEQIVTPLLMWYQENKRDLPWRRTEDPYAIWISEVMLQQTRTEAVIDYYNRFLTLFPNIVALKDANDDCLYKAWEGLGYYTRARNLKRAAMIIVNQYHGIFPRDYQMVLSLPGIGSYTAGAITSIAFHEPNPAVDGNVLRVLSRLLLLEESILNPFTKLKIEHILSEVLTKENAKDLNQALMELGATICLPNQSAKCDQCPIQAFCKAKEQEMVEFLPKKEKKVVKKIEKKTILIIESNGKYALLKRKESGLLAGLYQFPEMEYTNEEESVISFCRKYHYTVLSIKALPIKKHVFTHLIWEMNGYLVKVKEEHDDFLFVSLKELENYSIPTAFSYYHPNKIDE